MNLNMQFRMNAYNRTYSYDFYADSNVVCSVKYTGYFMLLPKQYYRDKNKRLAHMSERYLRDVFDKNIYNM